MPLNWLTISFSRSRGETGEAKRRTCLLYTSDAADERSSVDLGGRRIIKKKINSRDRQRVAAESRQEEDQYVWTRQLDN